MADLKLRLNRDVLVLSASVAPLLSQQGMDVDRDLPMQYLLEPENIHDALQMQMASGAQVMVLETGMFTPAQLSRRNAGDDLPRLAETAYQMAGDFKPQHVAVALGAAGLPFDPSMTSSVKEVTNQYVRAAQAFAPYAPEAYLLEGFDSADELLCAVQGVKQVSDGVVFACINVPQGGALPVSYLVERQEEGFGSPALSQVACALRDAGAQVVGFATGENALVAAKYATQMTAAGVPVLAQLNVARIDKRQWEPTVQNPYHVARTMADAAPVLVRAGVQFLRAGGVATPAYTAALVAATSGTDVVQLSSPVAGASEN